MKIDEMKKRFIELLKASTDREGAEVWLTGQILMENDLNNETFWGVVCPSLETDGIIAYYSDPKNISSDYHKALLSKERMHEIFGNPQFLTEEKLRSTEAERAEIARSLYKNFKHRFTINEQSFSRPIARGKILTIEIIRDKTKTGPIKCYINGTAQEYKFKRNGRWTALYDVAENQYAAYERNILSYFNSQKTNPLYKTHNFEKTKIFKKDRDVMKPNITIKLVGQRRITQRSKKA